MRRLPIFRALTGQRLSKLNPRTDRFEKEPAMSSTESVPTPAEGGAKTCCDKKGCGKNGKCCVCCGRLLGYLGAGLLAATGLVAQWLWLAKLNPACASTLAAAGATFSAGSRFFIAAARHAGCNWFALPVVLVAVFLLHKKCCARCAPRLLFAYGWAMTLVALGGLISDYLVLVMIRAEKLGH